MPLLEASPSAKLDEGRLAIGQYGHEGPWQSYRGFTGRERGDEGSCQIWQGCLACSREIPWRGHRGLASRGQGNEGSH